MSQPHEPGCPVRVRDGLCPRKECTNITHDAGTFSAFPHHVQDGTRCPGFMDAEPMPDCERRKIVSKSGSGPHWKYDERRMMPRRIYVNATKFARRIGDERRSGSDRRKATP